MNLLRFPASNPSGSCMSLLREVVHGLKKQAATNDEPASALMHEIYTLKDHMLPDINHCMPDYPLF